MVLSYATIHLQQVSAHKAAELQRTVQTLQQVDSNKSALEESNQHLQQEIKTEYVPKQQHEQELQQKQQEIERIKLSKAQEKEAEAQRLASIHVAEQQPVAKQAIPSNGSGCEWLRGRLAANGITSNDIEAAMYIATHESTCQPTAINPGSGACNVFQELPCGKWGGTSNIDAHIRGATAYARARYGSWWGAYNFWIANKWW